MTVIAGVLYIGITFIGVRGLHYIGLVSVPLFVVLGVWVAGDCRRQPRLGGGRCPMPATNGKGAMSMGVGLTIVLTLFVDAGTVTADFNRWAKDLQVSLISTFSAFPFANLVAMLVGGIMTAALAMPNANPFGADNMFGYMNDKQLGWLIGACLHLPLLQSRLGLLALPLQLGNRLVAHHAAATCASLAIALGIDRHHRRRRQCLGVLHPMADAARHPGAADRRDHPGRSIPAAGECGDRPPNGGLIAFIAWAAGSVVAFFVEEHAPEYSTAIAAFMVAGVVYGVLQSVTAPRRNTPRSHLSIMGRRLHRERPPP